MVVLLKTKGGSITASERDVTCQMKRMADGVTMAFVGFHIFWMASGTGGAAERDWFCA